MLDGKQPYAIARRDHASLAFAGFWEGWRGSDDVTLRKFILSVCPELSQAFSMI